MDANRTNRKVSSETAVHAVAGLRERTFGLRT